MRYARVEAPPLPLPPPTTNMVQSDGGSIVLSYPGSVHSAHNCSIVQYEYLRPANTDLGAPGVYSVFWNAS